MMMKKNLFVAVILFSSMFAASQRLDTETKYNLHACENDMKKNAVDIVQGIEFTDRFLADSIFTRKLVKALKTPNSFYYPFDSLLTISSLYAPDSSFRIFSWQLMINENAYRQRGAIQMNTADGSLKLFPLIDRSDVIARVSDTVSNHLGWVGALYYKMMMKEEGGKKYYTLFGFDDYSIRSSRKYIEVLHFDNGEPVFGGNFFQVPNDSIRPKNPARYVMEFKKAAGPRLNYDKDLDLIIMEHLISESNQPTKPWTYIGDGDYEGFRWLNGKWLHIEKVFNQVIPEGQAPAPVPLNEKEKKL